MGGSFEGHCHTGAVFTFVAGDKGEPVEQKVRLEFNGSGDTHGHLNITRRRHPRDVLRLEGPNLRFDLDRSEVSYDSISTWLSRYVRRGYLPFRGELADFRKSRRPRVSDKEEIEFAKFVTFIGSGLPLPDRPSFVVEALDPALPPRKRAYASRPAHLVDDKRDSDLTIHLGTIGKELGLWAGVDVRDRPNDRSTEVLIKTPSGWQNLVDVGYGLHSLLPVIQVMHKSQTGTVFLLQQPEIYLHPRAQANLAQFVAESDCGFVIETHSEHFMDRFRICVMEGSLRPEELSIVYFEPTPDGKRSRMHSMAVDAQANLLNVPESYRSFFLQETERLLGFLE